MPVFGLPSSARVDLFDGSSHWWALVGSLRHDTRFPIRSELLSRLLEFCQTSTRVVQKGSLLYRARLNRPRMRVNGPEPWPVGEMSAPPPEVAKGGRLNPPGLPYLYLAADVETAVAELRPWRGADVTVATFECVRDIPVFTLPAAKSADEQRDFALKQLAEEFSTPVEHDTLLGYTVTQTIAEALKAACDPAMEGVEYPSAMRRDGRNIAIFGKYSRKFEEFVVPVTCQMWVVSDVSNELRQIGK